MNRKATYPDVLGPGYTDTDTLLIFCYWTVLLLPSPPLFPQHPLRLLFTPTSSSTTTPSLLFALVDNAY